MKGNKNFSELNMNNWIKTEQKGGKNQPWEAKERGNFGWVEKRWHIAEAKLCSLEPKWLMTTKSKSWIIFFFSLDKRFCDGRRCNVASSHVPKN